MQSEAKQAKIEATHERRSLAWNTCLQLLARLHPDPQRVTAVIEMPKTNGIHVFSTFLSFCKLPCKIPITQMQESLLVDSLSRMQFDVAATV